jgi:methionine aminotransferase
MRSGHNQYAPMAGVAALRAAIAAKVSGLYGAAYDPEHEVTVTAGATQALFTAVAALVHPGDEVIVFEPVYDSYVPAIELQGGVVRRARLSAPDYRPDWRRSGAGDAADADDHDQHAPQPHRQVDRRRPGRAGGDHPGYGHRGGGRRGVRAHRLRRSAPRECCPLPELAARSVIVSSFGKTFHVTGWKVGYVLAPRALMAEFRKVHQFNVFTVNTPVQLALADYMEDPARYGGLAAFYQAKRDFFGKGWRDPLRIAALRRHVFPDGPLRGDLGRRRRGLRRLAHSPGRRGGDSPVGLLWRRAGREVIRFCFAKRDETLEAAFERLRRFC